MLRHWAFMPAARHMENIMTLTAQHLLVVVEDDDHVGVQAAGMVHRLVCHAARDCAVANDRDAVVVPLLRQGASGLMTACYLFSG